MSKPTQPLPDWEQVLTSAAHLQKLFPDAVLVGGTASALAAGHRVSLDADHVLTDLRARFDEVLAELESVAGWRTARVQRPVQIPGSLDGIETGVRQLIRQEPLDTRQVQHQGLTITVPTDAEMLRIKAVLILKRNATRDYLDFVAMQDRLGEAATVEAEAVTGSYSASRPGALVDCREAAAPAARRIFSSASGAYSNESKCSRPGASPSASPSRLMASIISGGPPA
jgi:hypothetical protein